MKFAIINKDNVVVNVIIYPEGNFIPPRKHIVVESLDAEIGDIYNPETKVFVKP